VKKEFGRVDASGRGLIRGTISEFAGGIGENHENFMDNFSKNQQVSRWQVACHLLTFWFLLKLFLRP
jgi:hypothetical protein